MEFTPSKAEHPLQGMELQEKDGQKIKGYRISLYKEPTVKGCLLIPELKSFRLLVKGKHSIRRNFQGLAVRGKKLFT